MAKNTKTYSKEQIQEVLDKIPDLGISKAATKSLTSAFLKPQSL